jgi:hypothetical protein
MSSVKPNTDVTRRSSNLARAWIAVAAICGLACLYVALYYWSADHIGRGAAASIPTSLGFALDELLVVWIVFPFVLLLALIVITFIGWRSILSARSRAHTGSRPRLRLVGTILASICASGLALMKLLSLLGTAFSATMCETTTFEDSISPNGRYRAAVIERNCGAMSSSNRQVVLMRVPFFSASQSILYFNKDPALRLAWNERELTIVGDKPRRSLAHPPPDPLLWGGILVRYLGPGDQ